MVGDHMGILGAVVFVLPAYAHTPPCPCLFCLDAQVCSCTLESAPKVQISPESASMACDLLIQRALYCIPFVLALTCVWLNLTLNLGRRALGV